MRSEFFIVADHVQVYAEGKLVIMGAFDMIRAAKVPLAFRPFGVALKPCNHIVYVPVPFR